MPHLTALAGLVPLLVGFVFVALPVVLVVGAVRTRARQRSWTPATAVVRRVRTEGGGEHRTRLVAMYEYRDASGATHTGEGDVGRQGLPVGGAEQVIDILVDPLDGSRSMVDPKQQGVGTLACAVPLALVFGVIGLALVVTGLGVVVAGW